MNEEEPKGPPFVFEDRNGKKWDVTLTLGGAKRIDAGDYSAITDKEFSILSPEKSLFMELLTDTSLLFAMIWALVQDQVKDNLGIDPKTGYDKAELAFLDSFDGPAMQAGKRAFWGALSDFFPEHRTALLTLIRQIQKTEARVGMELQALIPDLDRVMEKEIKSEVEKVKAQLQEVGEVYSA